MSEQKLVTERNAVLREREAFAQGYRDGSKNWTEGAYVRSREAARMAYPLPKVTRPRVKLDPMSATHCGTPVLWMAREWGHKDAPQMCIVCSWDGGKTFDGYAPRGGSSLVMTLERVKLWADLLANPLEEVEADA